MLAQIDTKRQTSQRPNLNTAREAEESRRVSHLYASQPLGRGGSGAFRTRVAEQMPMTRHIHFLGRICLLSASRLSFFHEVSKILQFFLFRHQKHVDSGDKCLYKRRQEFMKGSLASFLPFRLVLR